MALEQFFGKVRTLAGVAAVVLGSAGGAAAVDTPAAPAPVYAAAPVYSVAPGGCATCQAAPAADCGSPGCATCAQKRAWHHKECTPYVTHLRPGACFGYFQTQWHRWENVCPLPYQGVGLNDAPPLPTPAATGSDNPVGPGAGAPPSGKSGDPLPNPTKSPENAPKPDPLPLPPMPDKFKK